MPPVFGKEMDDEPSMAASSYTGSGLFYYSVNVMKGFFKVQTPDQLYKKMDRFKPLSSEKVSVGQSLHRVLSEDIHFSHRTFQNSRALLSMALP